MVLCLKKTTRPEVQHHHQHTIENVTYRNVRFEHICDLQKIQIASFYSSDCVEEVKANRVDIKLFIMYLLLCPLQTFYPSIHLQIPNPSHCNKPSFKNDKCSNPSHWSGFHKTHHLCTTEVFDRGTTPKASDVTWSFSLDLENDTEMTNESRMDAFHFSILIRLTEWLNSIPLCQAGSQSAIMTKIYICGIDRAPALAWPPVIYNPSRPASSPCPSLLLVKSFVSPHNLRESRIK